METDFTSIKIGNGNTEFGFIMIRRWRSTTNVFNK